MGKREDDYKLIEQAAINGDRAPLSSPYGPISRDSFTSLLKQNRIRSEVYSKNWRVITLLDGPHRGKSTAPCPWGGKPYMINGLLVTEQGKARNRL